MKKIRIYGNPGAKRVFLQLTDEHDQELMGSQTEKLKELLPGQDWCIAVIPVQDWGQDLTPWSAPPAYGKEPFGDGASKTLQVLINQVIPELEEQYQKENADDLHMIEGNQRSLGEGRLKDVQLSEEDYQRSNTDHQRIEATNSLSREYYLCGYSLAGLFALWAACETNVFSGVAAVSPSVWYPGWLDFAQTHQIKTPKVYLSLGEKEPKTRNPVMRLVGDAIRAEHELLKEAGIRTTLEWNPGNHFVDSDLRTAKGMAWLLTG